MSVSNTGSAVLIVLVQALISGCFAQSYSDLEALGINCPSRDRCRGYRNKLTYMDRSCECDLECTAYKDCCIDALPSRSSRPQAPRPPARTDVTCLHYGEHDHTGVYVVSKCSSRWNGPREVNLLTNFRRKGGYKGCPGITVRKLKPKYVERNGRKNKVCMYI